MDLRQLAALVAIADHGSFSAAARALFTVQSNISSHIARLERELGVTLVDRHDGQLTPEGALVLERARRVQRELEAITADVASLRHEVAGTVRLGVIGTTARWLMPQLMTRMAERHPKVRLMIIDGSTSTLVPPLTNGQLDAAIVHLPVSEPELQVHPLFSEDLLVLAHRDHPIAAFDAITLEELVAYPLLLPPPGTALRRVLDHAAAERGLSFRAQAEIDGVRLLASLAFEGYGASVVPSTVVPGWLKGDFKRIAVDGLPQRLVGWAHRRRPLPTPPASALQATLTELLVTKGRRQPGVHVVVGTEDEAAAVGA
jgi:LysR family hydrogen peroxide-inducible transcriptional activator